MVNYENNFSQLIADAQSGNNEALTYLIEMFTPLIEKHSKINGLFDEDLKQIIVLQIVKKIKKFKI